MSGVSGNFRGVLLFFSFDVLLRIFRRRLCLRFRRRFFDCKRFLNEFK